MATKSSRRSSRILSGVAYTILAVLGVFALLLVVLGFLARPGADGVSRLANRPLLTVLSGSMRPVFDPGDLIIDNPITREQAGRLVAGDIITFHINNSSASNLITHRIVAVNPQSGPNGQVTYETKGDANNTPDVTPVAPEQIVGTYRGHVPSGGYVLQAAQNKVVFLWVICAALIVLVVAEIGKRWAEPQNDADGESAGGAGDPDRTDEIDDEETSAGTPESGQHADSGPIGTPVDVLEPREVAAALVASADVSAEGNSPVASQYGPTPAFGGAGTEGGRRPS